MADKTVQMLNTPTKGSGLNPGLNQALRDMREVNGRNPETGAGKPNASPAALLIGCVIVDTLAGPWINEAQQERNWIELLSPVGFGEDQAQYVYRTFKSLQHGYGVPKPLEGRSIALTADVESEPITVQQEQAYLSVPSFLNTVEALVSQNASSWDSSLIDTTVRLS